MILEHQKFRAEIWKCKHSWNWLAGFSKLRSSRKKPLRRLTDFSHPQRYRNYQFRHIVDLFSLTLVTALLLSRKLKGLRRFKETLSIRKNPHKSPRNWGFPLEKKFVPPPFLLVLSLNKPLIISTNGVPSFVNLILPDQPTDKTLVVSSQPKNLYPHHQTLVQFTYSLCWFTVQTWHGIEAQWTICNIIPLLISLPLILV